MIGDWRFGEVGEALWAGLVEVGEVGRRAACLSPSAPFGVNSVEGVFVCASAVVGYNRGGPPMATPMRCASTHREVVLTGLYEGVTR